MVLCFQKLFKILDVYHPKFLQLLSVHQRVKNWPIFQEKSLAMGTFIWQNDPQKWVWVSRLGWHTASVQKANLNSL